MMTYFTMIDGDTNKFETLTAMKELQKERGITDHLIINSFNEYISKGEEDNKIDTCKRYWYTKAKSKKRIPDDFMRFLFEIFEEKFHITRRDIFEQLKKKNVAFHYECSKDAQKEIEFIMFNDDFKLIFEENGFFHKLPKDTSMNLSKKIFNEYLQKAESLYSQECYKRIRKVMDEVSTAGEITISEFESILYSNDYVKEVMEYLPITKLRENLKEEVYNQLMKLSYSDCTYILNITLTIPDTGVESFIKCYNRLNSNHQKEVNKFIKKNMPKSIRLEQGLIDDEKRLAELKRAFEIEQSFINSRSVQENDNKKEDLINERINALNATELSCLSKIIDSFSRTKSEKEMKNMFKKCIEFIFVQPNRRKKLFDMMKKFR